jgi:hypothetical protein
MKPEGVRRLLPADLQAAKTSGRTVPNTLLARADEVID